MIVSWDTRNKRQCCSDPNQGVLGPVPPGDKDRTVRQPSGNVLP
jgi:hypothetical protein